MPLDPSVDKIRVRGRVQTQAGTADRPPTLFPTVQTLVNKTSHSRIRLGSIDPSTNQVDGTAAAPFYFNNSTGDWWADVIAVDDADVLASGQTQWGQWGVQDDQARYYVEPKLSGSATIYANATTGAPLAQGSGGIRTVWLDDLAQLFSPVATPGLAGLDVEGAQDAAAALFTGGTHTGIGFAYDDAGNRVNATVTVTGDLPEASAVASSPVTATDLLGKTTRFTGTVSQPAPPALPGRVFAVGLQSTGLTLNRDGTDVFVDDAGNSATTFTPPTVGVRTLHCSITGQWRTTGGHVPQSVLAAVFAPRTTRRTALGFGTAGDNGTFSTGSINPRYPIRIAVDTTRWRLKLANSDIKNGAAGTAGQQFRGAWIGPHLMGTTEGTGNFTQAPVNAVPNPDAAIPVDNSYYVSPWVTDPAAQIPAAVDYLLSIQTFASANTPIWRTNVGSFLSFAAGTGGTTAPNPSQNKAGMFDLIIEFEYVDNGRNRMGFFIGDSITAGLGGDNTVGNPSPYSYPQQHGLRTGHAVINAGCAGDQATPWAPGTGPRWTRFDIGTYLPDYAVVLFGTNDMTGLVSVATYQTNIAAIVAKLRSLGVLRVFLGLVPPKNGRVAGTLTAAASAGATSITSSVSFANGSTIAIGLGANQEFVTTTGGPTGSGPYTIPVPALANAHSSGELVADQQEGLRQGYNNWLKSIPAGATGIVDFDSVLRDPVNQIALRSDWTTDGVHMTRAGYQRMAATVPVP